MTKKPTIQERNKVFRLKEKNRPKMNTVLIKGKLVRKPNIAQNKRFVKLNNRLNKIDMKRVGRKFSATLTVNKKGIIKQRK